VASTELPRHTDSRFASGLAAEREQHAEERVAGLQRVVAMLLEKNEELRQQLVDRGRQQL
jgi:hypothetical protein